MNPDFFSSPPPGNDTIIRDPDTIFSKYKRVLFSNLISSQFDKNRIGFCKFEYMRYLMFRRMNDIKHVSRGSLLTLDVVEIYRMDRVKRSRFSASSGTLVRINCLSTFRASHEQTCHGSWPHPLGVCARVSAAPRGFNLCHGMRLRNPPSVSGFVEVR